MSLILNALEFAGPAGSPGPAVVILHGLFGSARNWQSIAQRLAADRQVFALDLRNHGASPWDDRMGYPDLVEDVRRFIGDRGLDRPVILGHSMGGKTAMLLALRYPALVRAAIVVDIAPCDYDHDYTDYIQAMQAIDLAVVKRRTEVDHQLASAIPDPGTRQFLLQNLVKRGDGLVWRLNLAAIASNMNELTGFPPQAFDLVYDDPALFVTGERSDYVEPVHHDDIARLFPQARLTVIPGAGHRVHAEQPDFFHSAVKDFLAGL